MERGAKSQRGGAEKTEWNGRGARGPLLGREGCT